MSGTRFSAGNYRVLRLAFGFAVLLVLVLFLDWSFIAGLSAAQYVLSALVIFGLVLTTWFEAERVYVLCRPRLPRTEITRMVLIAHFVTNFTPSGLGGDGYKVYALGRTFGFSGAAALVLLERAMGMLILLGVSFAAVMVYGDQWAEGVMQLREQIALPAGYDGTRVGLFAALAMAALVAAWFWRSRLLRFASDFLSTLRRLPRRALANFCAMTLCLHVARSALLCLQLKVFGYDLGLEEAWVVLTIAALASMLPISPGGLGVREAATVAALAPFAVDYHVALLVSLVMRLANVCQAVLGAVLISGGRRPGLSVADIPDS